MSSALQLELDRELTLVAGGVMYRVPAISTLVVYENVIIGTTKAGLGRQLVAQLRPISRQWGSSVARERGN
jgi:hypothetical protein